VSELRFHRDLYSGEAVDAAVHAFADLARFELREEGAYWVVEVSECDGERDREIAGELSNYALGLTIRARCQ